MFGFSLFFLVYMFGFVKIVDLLFKEGIVVKKNDYDNLKLFCEVCEEGYSKIV